MPTREYRDRFPTLEEFDEEMLAHGLEFEPSFVASMRRALTVVYAIAHVVNAPMEETLKELAPVSRQVEPTPTRESSYLTYKVVIGRQPVRPMYVKHACVSLSPHVIRTQCLANVSETEEGLDESFPRRVSHFRDGVMYIE